jgi:DNA-binding MarR family transcriptional regulator
MQVAKTIVRDVSERLNLFSVSEKEEAILYAIGLDEIPTATSFVDYMSLEYSCSASGIWYTLKRLKEKGLVDFAERGKGEKDKALSLTALGKEFVRKKSTGVAARNLYPGRSVEHMRVGATF